MFGSKENLNSSFMGFVPNKTSFCEKKKNEEKLFWKTVLNALLF